MLLGQRFQRFADIVLKDLAGYVVFLKQRSDQIGEGDRLLCPFPDRGRGLIEGHVSTGFDDQQSGIPIRQDTGENTRISLHQH